MCPLRINHLEMHALGISQRARPKRTPATVMPSPSILLCFFHANIHTQLGALSEQ